MTTCVHYHVLVTDGVFSDDGQGGARFHPSAGVGPEDVATVERQIRQRGLRWLHRHGHLDDAAVHALDAADHAGGWSVDASVSVPDWDRHGLERLGSGTAPGRRSLSSGWAAWTTSTWSIACASRCPTAGPS